MRFQFNAMDYAFSIQMAWIMRVSNSNGMDYAFSIQMPYIMRFQFKCHRLCVFLIHIFPIEKYSIYAA
jgi:hypothetical protein